MPELILPPARRIYPLIGYPEEVVAVAFAKTSRSPRDFDDIIAELNTEAAGAFNEKWVVTSGEITSGYGHKSVAEHAVPHIAFQNVSNVAAKVLEDCRLASYTEKSTRFQFIPRGYYWKPPRIMASPLASLYVETADACFEAYHGCIAALDELMRQKHPQAEGEPDSRYKATIKARVCDVVRYFLPAATYTNIGMTANAREFEWAIVKLLSHPLEEMREIGRELKAAALQVTPTLVKYAEANPYLMETRDALDMLAAEYTTRMPQIEEADSVTIIESTRRMEEIVVASILYPYLKHPFAQVLSLAYAMGSGERGRIVDEALKRRGAFDQAPRELENATFLMDILMDYGAFRDIQRHRMATQLNQDLTVEHGYQTPPEIIEIGAEGLFDEIMERAARTHRAISASFPAEAQYTVPMAFRKRVLFSWNLRELHHFIPLRSGNKGHPSYRRIAQTTWHRLNELSALLARYIRVDMSEMSVSTVGTRHVSDRALGD